MLAFGALAILPVVRACLALSFRCPAHLKPNGQPGGSVTFDVTVAEGRAAGHLKVSCWVWQNAVETNSRACGYMCLNCWKAHMSASCRCMASVMDREQALQFHACSCCVHDHQQQEPLPVQSLVARQPVTGQHIQPVPVRACWHLRYLAL